MVFFKFIPCQTTLNITANLIVWLSTWYSHGCMS